jgi:hypothetical protein
MGTNTLRFAFVKSIAAVAIAAAAISSVAPARLRGGNQGNPLPQRRQQE